LLLKEVKVHWDNGFGTAPGDGLAVGPGTTLWGGREKAKHSKDRRQPEELTAQ